jgi:putative transcriptional regulator
MVPYVPCVEGSAVQDYGIGKRALQEWEQGGRQPDSAARAYLTVIAKEPAVVRRALKSE